MQRNYMKIQGMGQTKRRMRNTFGVVTTFTETRENIKERNTLLNQSESYDDADTADDCEQDEEYKKRFYYEEPAVGNDKEYEGSSSESDYEEVEENLTQYEDSLET